MRRFLMLLAGLLGAFGIGVLLFNFVVMPRFVQHAASVPVPRLVGLGLGLARERCAQLGLGLDAADSLYSEGIPKDQVISQFPEAGATVKPGRMVRVRLSRGTQEVKIPDVRGMSLRQATLELENAELIVGRIARVYEGNDERSQGQIVQAMRPRPGAPASSGRKVDLLVAVGGNPEPYLMPDLAGRALDEVRALIEAQGFRVGRVRYKSRAGVYPGTVLGHEPGAGAPILLGETIDLEAATPD